MWIRLRENSSGDYANVDEWKKTKLMLNLDGTEHLIDVFTSDDFDAS